MKKTNPLHLQCNRCKKMIYNNEVLLKAHVLLDHGGGIIAFHYEDKSEVSNLDSSNGIVDPQTKT